MKKNVHFSQIKEINFKVFMAGAGDGSTVNSMSALAESLSLSSAPSIHNGQFTTAYNSSYRRSNALLWLLRAQHTHAQFHTETEFENK